MLPFLLLAALSTEPAVTRQVELEPGLSYKRFETETPSEHGTTVVHVLSVDPEYFELVLLNASRSADGRTRSARAWGEEHGLLATINASMYQQDHRTSVSLMTTRTHTNNAYVSKDKCVLAFDPVDPDMPPVRLIDRQCDDLDALRRRYGTLIQSIRMISCEGRNVWSPQERRTSIAALGIDDKGAVHLIHMTTPRSTYDLIEILLELPLRLQGAMYLEGGTPAQLFVDHPQLQLETAGVWCSEQAPEGEHALALPIPNVIGVVRR